MTSDCVNGRFRKEARWWEIKKKIHILFGEETCHQKESALTTMMFQTVGATFAAVKTLLQEERVTTHQSLMRKYEGCHQEDSIFIAIRLPLRNITQKLQQEKVLNEVRQYSFKVN